MDKSKARATERYVLMAAIAATAGSALFFNDATVTIESLRARLAELNETSIAIQARADAERGRDLSPDEQTELDAVMGEFDEVEASIKRRERIANQATRMATPEPRRAAPNPVAEPAIATNTAPRDGLRNTRLTTLEERQRWGFANMGEFSLAVRQASNPGSTPDQRLIQNAAASTYGTESVGADGGFTVPPEWRGEIMKLVDGADSLLGMTDQQSVSSNNITFPVDETTDWQTTGGILGYWDSEAATMSQSKPSLKELQIKLHRLTALVPVTEELLDDAAALSGYITQKAGAKIDFKVTDALINGTGVGQPMGILNAPCKVKQTKVGSQTATTIHADNIVAMVARMPAKSFTRAVWLVNQDCIPQILKLGFVVTSASSTTGVGAGALYLPPNGLANQSPYGSILGRPVVVTEACSTLGTEGDIILADMSKYLTAVKGGLKSDVSIHLWFDQNLVAYRFVLRMNGQPWLSSAITRKNGSNTLSHFITLESR